MTAAGFQLGDDELTDRIAARMAEVEERLEQAVTGADELVDGPLRHLAAAGGKRLRPALTLLTAELGQPVRDEVTRAAVAVELTHLATLYHDDVMDSAAMRRGAPSAHAVWDNSVAILTGDLLFARASQLVASLGAEAVRVHAETFERLCLGQLHETLGPREGEDPIAHYIQVLADKTGSLIATSGRFGALLSGAPEPVVERITDACEAIGVAWQLSDDLIDVAASAGESGKTPGTDLREGVRTLPVLHVLASDDPADARLRELLQGPVPEEHLEEALTLLRANPAMDRARAELLRWIDRAKADLAELPAIPAREALLSLCDFVVERTG